MKAVRHEGLRLIRTSPIRALTVILILASTVLTLAHAGTRDSGGGNGVGLELFDFYENKGTKPLKIEALPFYQTDVEPILSRIEALFPLASLELRQRMQLSEFWFLEPKPLSEQSCENHSMIAVEKQIVACQNELEVRIYEPWFLASERWRDSGKSGDINPPGIIIHELLLRGLLQNAKKNPKIDLKKAELNLRRLNRYLFLEFNSRTTAEDFRSRVKRYDFELFFEQEGVLISSAERQVYARYLQEQWQDLCKSVGYLSLVDLIEKSQKPSVYEKQETSVAGHLEISKALIRARRYAQHFNKKFIAEQMAIIGLPQSEKQRQAAVLLRHASDHYRDFCEQVVQPGEIISFSFD